MEPENANSFVHIKVYNPCSINWKMCGRLDFNLHIPHSSICSTCPHKTRKTSFEKFIMERVSKNLAVVKPQIDTFHCCHSIAIGTKYFLAYRTWTTLHRISWIITVIAALGEHTIRIHVWSKTNHFRNYRDKHAYSNNIYDESLNSAFIAHLTLTVIFLFVLFMEACFCQWIKTLF